jgi:hypothetical protein
LDLRNRGDAMRMRYEREKAPCWGGSEERIGQDDDAEGLCVKVGSDPSRTDRPVRGACCEPS